MKARPSKLDKFSEKLHQWFGLEKLPLLVVAKRLAKLGCPVSISRLSVWWEKEMQTKMQNQLLAGIASGAQLNKEVERRFEKNAPPEIETLKKLLQTIVMQLAVKGQGDSQFLELAASLMDRILKIEEGRRRERGLLLDERRVTLLEKKANERDAAERVMGENMSPIAKMQRIRQIFGMPS